MKLSHRFATKEDIPELARLDRQLLEDKLGGTEASIEELAGQLEQWLFQQSNTGVVFFPAGSPEKTCVFAIYRQNRDSSLFLRKFFVCREFRGQGLGQSAMEVLKGDIWPPDTRVLVDCDVCNVRAVKFWASVGFDDKTLTLRTPPGDSIEKSA